MLCAIVIIGNSRSELIGTANEDHQQTHLNSYSHNGNHIDSATISSKIETINGTPIALNVTHSAPENGVGTEPATGSSSVHTVSQSETEIITDSTNNSANKEEKNKNLTCNTNGLHPAECDTQPSSSVVRVSTSHDSALMVSDLEHPQQTEMQNGNLEQKEEEREGEEDRQPSPGKPVPAPRKGKSKLYTAAAAASLP